MTKKKLSTRVSNDFIDSIYDKAIAAGSVGGKLCGAGSGGFLLMVVPGRAMAGFRYQMAAHPLIAVDLDTDGASIIGF